jgi:hypothetical protein
MYKKIIMDGGYQEVVIEQNTENESIVLRLVERQDKSFNAKLNMSYNDALRLANELIDLVSKNK